MPGTPRRFADASSVQQVLKALLRLIHRDRLAAGGRLPTQRDLRRLLGVSNHSVSAAMEVLVAAGMVERRGEAGTALLDPGRPIPRVWSCGVGFWPAAVEETAFYACLFQSVQRALLARSVRPRLYAWAGGVPGAMRTGDFPGLDEDLDDGLVDAWLCPGAMAPEALGRLAAARCPALHAGSWEQAPAGAVIDRTAFARQAVAALAALGCRRPAMVDAGDGAGSLAEGFRAAVAEAGLGDSGPLGGGGSSSAAGREAGRRLLALDPGLRPDALVVGSDWLALGLAEVLAATPGPRPRLAVQVNRQAPVPLPLPALRFAVDIEALAEAAVAAAMERMLDPDAPPALRRLAPVADHAER